MILAERAARLEAEATAARAQAANSSTDALIARLKLEIEKLRRELFGTRSERKARLLDQLESSSRIWRPMPRRTSWRRKRPRDRRVLPPSSASGRRASPSLSSCRANAS